MQQPREKFRIGAAPPGPGGSKPWNTGHSQISFSSAHSPTRDPNEIKALRRLSSLPGILRPARWFSSLTNAALTHKLSLLHHARRYVDEFVSNDGQHYGTFYERSFADGIIAARLHDFLSKYSLMALGRALKLHFDGSPAGFALNTATHYSRGQAGTDHEWAAAVGNGRVSVGVQIQGHSYRHFASASGGSIEARRKLLRVLCAALSGVPHYEESACCQNGWFAGSDNWQLRSKSLVYWRRYDERAALTDELNALDGLDQKRAHALEREIAKLTREMGDRNHEFYAFTRHKFLYTARRISDKTFEELRNAIRSSLESAAERLREPRVTAALTEFRAATLAKDQT